MLESDIKKLLASAQDAQKNARAKYSNFKVGAALQTKSGKIYTGCNVESSSFGLTICAERVALVKALSEGENAFSRIAIIADINFCPPCGACRQLLFDYAPEIDIILFGEKTYKTYNLKELLPEAFEDSQLLKK